MPRRMLDCLDLLGHGVAAKAKMPQADHGCPRGVQQSRNRDIADLDKVARRRPEARWDRRHIAIAKRPSGASRAVSL